VSSTAAMSAMARSRCPLLGGAPAGSPTVTAPAAVRVVELEAPLADVQLSATWFGEPYRSLIVVARLEGEPLGVVATDVAEGRLSRFRLAGALQWQLGPELEEWFARRGRPLPDSLPREGIAVERAAAPSTSRSVSVVVTTSGYTARLERCLRSLLASRHGEFEVIVVDNRPAGGVTRAMLSERFAYEPRVRYVEEPRRGLSTARNAGLMAAEGLLVAFTEDDAVVEPDWIARAAAAFDRADDVACVTGLMLPLQIDKPGQPLLDQFAAYSTRFEPWTFRLAERGLAYTPGLTGAGADIVVRADLARRLGGFDISLGSGTPSAGGQDLDLYLRLLRAGYAIAYEPRAIVSHEHAAARSRQAFRRGVGLGAALSKQLVAGPERRCPVRRVSAGVSFLSGLRHPGHRSWLERAGVLLGPAAYLASAATRRIGGNGEAQATRSSVRLARVPLSSGRTVSVVSFRDPGPGPKAEGARPRVLSGLARVLVVAAALACVAAPLAVAATVVFGPVSLWGDVSSAEAVLYALAALTLTLLLATQLGRRRQAA
jgi:O-antigen biosynthesis protein